MIFISFYGKMVDSDSHTKYVVYFMSEYFLIEFVTIIICFSKEIPYSPIFCSIDYMIMIDTPTMLFCIILLPYLIYTIAFILSELYETIEDFIPIVLGIPTLFYIFDIINRYKYDLINR